MARERKHYSAEDKVTALRRHFLDKVPISQLCTELDVAPSMFYRWQKEFFENGTRVFIQARDDDTKKRDQRIEQLEAKLTAKNEVVAELLEEHVRLKKSIGEI
jgi:transposase-like protein